MTFTDIVDRLKKMGITQGALEKACGYYKGKITEVAAGRIAVKEEFFAELANGLEVLSEELALFAEEVREAESYTVGQYSVYEFTFPNDKKYYGMTISIQGRWQNGNGYKTQLVGKAIEEFGWENVKKRIIAENLTKENAKLIERTLIKATGSDMPGFGYNVL